MVHDTFGNCVLKKPVVHSSMCVRTHTYVYYINFILQYAETTRTLYITDHSVTILTSRENKEIQLRRKPPAQQRRTSVTRKTSQLCQPRKRK